MGTVSITARFLWTFVISSHYYIVPNTRLEKYGPAWTPSYVNNTNFLLGGPHYDSLKLCYSFPAIL